MGIDFICNLYNAVIKGRRRICCLKLFFLHFNRFIPDRNFDMYISTSVSFNFEIISLWRSFSGSFIASRISFHLNTNELSLLLSLPRVAEVSPYFEGAT